MQHNINVMVAGKTNKAEIEIQVDAVCFACPKTDLRRLLLSVGPDSSVFRRCEKLWITTLKPINPFYNVDSKTHDL